MAASMVWDIWCMALIFHVNEDSPLQCRQNLTYIALDAPSCSVLVDALPTGLLLGDIRALNETGLALGMAVAAPLP